MNDFLLFDLPLGDAIEKYIISYVCALYLWAYNSLSKLFFVHHYIFHKLMIKHIFNLLYWLLKVDVANKDSTKISRNSIQFNSKYINICWWCLNIIEFPWIANRQTKKQKIKITNWSSISTIKVYNRQFILCCSLRFK